MSGSSRSPTIQRSHAEPETSESADLSDTDADINVRHDRQSSSERREIRHRYRELMLETTQTEEGEEQNFGDLTDKLNQAENLFTNVHMSREAALDSKLVNMITTQGAVTARHLSTSIIDFHASEFVERLEPLIKHDGSVEDWNAFGRNVSVFFKRSPAFHFMRGTFTTEDVTMQKARRQQRRKDIDAPNAKKEAPEMLTVAQKSEQEATTEEVEQVLTLLRCFCSQVGGPVCLYEFVVDPLSFTQTILNIFHLSFLIKDGFVNMFLDDEGIPVVEDVKEPRPSSERTKNETVLIMNKKQWEGIIRKFGIKTALIPVKGVNSSNRTQSQDTNSGNPKLQKKKRTQ